MAKEVFPVEVVVGALAGGFSFEEIFEDYHLAGEQLRAALGYVITTPTSASPEGELHLGNTYL